MSIRPAVSGIVSRRRSRVAGAALVGALGLSALGAPAFAGEAVDEGEGATTVKPVTVEARRNHLDRDTGLAVLPGSLQDTPQAIQVISEQQLRQQGVTTLEQALRNVPGITIAIGEGGTLNGDQFKIRGFDAKDDVFLDGLRDFGVYTRDSFDYQEVQVLKGPSGALFGRGNVGGAINTISKGPKLRDFGEVDAFVGNGDYYRALSDFNRQIGPNSAVRINLMDASTGVVERDRIHSNRWGVAGAIGFGLETDSALTFNYFHQQDRRTPDYGMVLAQRPGSLIAEPASEYGVPRSNFLGYDTDTDRSRADILTERHVRKVSPGLTLTSDSRIGSYSRYFQYTTVDICNAACNTALFDNNPTTRPQAMFGGSGPYNQRDWGAQNISTARMEGLFGSLKNELILGWDLSYQKNKKTFFAYTLPVGFSARNTIPRDLLNPDPRPLPGYTVFLPTATNQTCPATGPCTTNVLGSPVFTNDTAATVLYTDGDSTDLGAFVTDRLWLNERLSVLASARVDGYRANFRSTSVTFVSTAISSKSTLFDPKLSLIWEPSRNQTWYVSWGRSATPQGTSIIGSGTNALTVSAKDLEPEVSQAWEAGAKVNVKGMSLTASVFDVRKSNATQTDPNTGFVQAQSGQKQEVRGFELGANGRMTRAWSLSVNYTYLDARIREDFSCTTTGVIVCKLNPYTIGRQVVFVPRHAASLWTNYDFDGRLEGWSLGGGVTYQSRLYLTYGIAGAAPNPTGLVKIGRTPESISLDGVLAYRTGRYRLAVNGYNLTDRLNYAQVFGTRATPAPGRTLILSLGVSF
ncbi:MAG: TonB-dependent receptor [Proteobacteria bacterium]|nr:TonB-dependent receptor [Pseudomonadota bacterium]